MQSQEQIITQNIESKILAIRNQYVMLDRDLAELYGVPTKRLNEQVKRNSERFPASFMFQLSEQEFENWRSQFATSSADKIGLRRPPYTFTEQGVAMLSAVLHSDTAIQMSIRIMNAFVTMRHFLQSSARVFAEIDSINRHLIALDMNQTVTDNKIEELFNLIDKYNIQETQGIFFRGQIFDAYVKFESIIADAKREIILIDNYADLTVLKHLTHKQSQVNVIIYTEPHKITPLDIKNFNDQYPTLTVKTTNKVHDRFLIIDHKILYHLGASLKDLGKKCFAFQIMDKSWIPQLLSRI